MTQAAEELLQQALQLPEEDRDRIAEALWRSLDEAHPGLHEEWTAEVNRRIAEIDEGKVQLIPGEEVMARLRARLPR